MAYQSTTDPSRKFGSAFRGKRFDSYHTEQPGGSNENEKSEPQQKHVTDKMTDPGLDAKMKNKHAEDASVETPSSVVEAHGPAHTTHVSHKEDGTHTTSSEHNDGYTHETMHGSAKEAHESAEQLSLERGGTEQASNVKHRSHPDQQGAESEERGYEMPELM